MHPFGVTLRVTADRPELLAALDHAVAHMPAEAGGRGDYALSIVTHADTADDPAWPNVAVDDTSSALSARCGSGLLHVDHATASALVDVPESWAAIDDALRCFVEGALSSLLIGADELYAVHSGLVVAPGGHGLLLRGESGAGKSTLTYACLQAGFAVASDDWVYAVPGTDAGRLHGYPWRMFLMPDTVGFFPELAGVAAVPHPSVDRWKLPIVPPVDQQRASADVDVVVFLSPEAGERVVPISAEQAIERWWRSALATERDHLPDGWVEHLLGRPCFVAERGPHPAATADALAQLAVSLM